MENDYNYIFEEDYRDAEPLDNLLSLEINKSSKEESNSTPLLKSTPKYKTHQLVIVDNKASFKPSIASYKWSIIFMLVALYYLISMNIMVGIPMFIAGLLFLNADLIPITFDKQTQTFHKGKPRFNTLLFRSKEVFIDFNEIISVQLLKNQMINGKYVFDGYEINLMLSENKRINIIGHGNLEVALEDAFQLSEFLNIPFINGLKDFKE